MSQLPADAQVVVIGGGVAGCSVAYHLARLGWTDVILVERHDLTEGTTWHSAGFVGQLRSTVTQTRMIMYSAGLYPELRELTGLDPGWHGVGGLRLATTPERQEELLRQAGAAETYGLDMEMLDAAGTLERFPSMEVGDVRGSLWLPGDGWLDPARLGRALAEGARRLGVKIFTGVEVTGVEVEDGRVHAVRLRATAAGAGAGERAEEGAREGEREGRREDGRVGRRDGGREDGRRDEWVVRTETVVNAAGAAAGVVGRLAGVDVPIVPIKHQYVVTKPMGVPADTPTVRDPDNIVYFREDGGGILVGGYIRTPQVWDVAHPLAEPRTLFAPDMAKFQESWESAVHRLPGHLAETNAQIAAQTTPQFSAQFTARPGSGDHENAEEVFRKVVHGPEAFTPDGEFLLGETAVQGFWVAAGFCVHGLAAAGGVGKVMAEWIVDGGPEYDVFGMDVRRFGAHARSARWAREKALDSYSKYYDIVYPGEERTAARPLRRSPAWVRHAALDATFGEKAGWERVNWFGSPAGSPAGSARASSSPSPGATRGAEPRGWAGRAWSPAIREECLATASAAGLFDQTSFSKLEVSGKNALADLERICGNRLDRPVGTVVYTQVLNERGGIDADVTVTRLAEDRFRVITGTAFGVHDAAILRRHGLEVRDVTSAHACYCLWGPRAYDILSALSDDDLTFGYMRAREISVGHVPVLAQRVTFVGEFGWELYCPAEFGLTLWDALMEAGLPYGMRPAGYRALDSMRLEKGYRVWGLDITPETTPLEAGLGFAVRPERRAALPAPRQTLRCLVVDDERDICLGGEPVRLNGRPVSRVTSGGYGCRVGRSIAYAYLPGGAADDAEGTGVAGVTAGTRVEVGLNGTWVGAEIVAEPLYDPGHDRVRSAPWTV
ncbi:FAD-dependent oxidoreductase [Planotetraspora silvatica]|uniref:FAD-dependent oxidoreductase n=1 Tax=Planotetraspora silvatica TaxID=234614 RepID=A0A8J3UXA9_9ACTN|nr:FAD-dependent oxidoreductase [Planotetraspora silvatica]GII50114.1 FAD-dependent oxidoreductase [Planotetraspora silvatica]